MVMAQAGHEVIVRILIRGGASVNDRDSMGRTTLYITASNGHEAVIRLLV